jgi:hypothetical protein
MDSGPVTQSEKYMSGLLFLAPGQTREFLQGDPPPDGAVFDAECWSTFVCTAQYTGVGTLSLVGIGVQEGPPFNDPTAFPVHHLRYTVRNDDQTTGISFRRVSVRFR